jgi:hypothetical protein
MVESLTNAISQRIRNPWFTGFVLAFVAFNWKAILLLFYPELTWNIRDRLAYLNDELYNEPSERCFLLAWPLAFAAFWVFIMPWLAALADTAANWASVWKERRADKMNARLPARMKEVADLQEQLEDERREHQKSVDKFQAEEKKTSEMQAQRDEAIMTFLKVAPESGRLLLLLADKGGAAPLAPSEHTKRLVSIGLVTALPNGRLKLTDLGTRIAEQHRM